jgi:hypothetical protein
LKRLPFIATASLCYKSQKQKNMKKAIVVVTVILSIFAACNSSRTMASIEPKQGKIDLPKKGELRIWKDILHPSFSVVLTNSNPKQSCEIYTVKSNGNEKWVSPSLLANSSLTITVPKDGHLFFKNFNPNTLTISYTVN